MTEHFSLKEFFVSKEFPEKIDWYLPTETDRLKCYLLAKLYLEPIRATHGTVTVLSGKRTRELNDAIGGSRNSHHLFDGMAAACDFTCNGLDKAFDTLSKFPSSSFGQIIFYPGRNFIHISLPTETHAGDILWSIEKGKYIRK